MNKYKHLRQILLTAIAVFGWGACAMAQTNYTITSNTTWTSAPDTLIGNITIASGKTLSIYGCSLQMDTLSTINVSTNATIEMYGTQIASFYSNKLWEGIVFRDSANLIMDNSQIKYAKTGVKHIYGNSLVQINDSYFYNCVKSLEFDSCKYNNQSHIINTVFDVATANNGLDFNHFFSVQFLCHISADNSHVPIILGSMFLNNNFGIAGYNYAINALKSDITVSCLNGIKSLFKGFDCAINIVDNYTHILNVTNSDFKSNSTGITTMSVGNTLIACCSFSLGNFDDTHYPYREGIVMNECKNYGIYGNVIRKASGSTITSSTGIYIKNLEGLNGFTSNIYGNTINELTCGIHTTGNNLLYSGMTTGPGLEICCNKITNCQYGIYNDGKIGNPQGSTTGSAGNNFSNNGRDIYNIDAMPIIYYYSGSSPSVYNVNLIHTSSNNCQTVTCNTCVSNGRTEPDETFSEGRSGDYIYNITGEDELKALAGLYYGKNDIESRYVLVEVLKEKGDYESAEFELKQILYSGDLTENSYSEYETYKELFYLEKGMYEQGRGWKSMTHNERAKLNRIASDGYGRAQHTAIAISKFYNIVSDSKQPSFGLGDFPWTCTKAQGGNYAFFSPIYSNELKFVFNPTNVCAISGDTIFVQGIYRPAPNEYPEDAPTWWYGISYDGAWAFEIRYSDSNSEKCLSDKQCQDINLQITCESDFATGKHYATQCAETWVNGTWVNTNDTLGNLTVKQLPEFATPNHDHGEGTVTISWTGFDGTPRQHVLYFIIDDHFYIDYVGYGVEENEDVSANGVRVFPNPTDGTFAIAAENITNVEIFDLAGQKVITDNSGSQTMNAGNLTTGVYFLKVETQNGTKYGKLMVK